MMASSITMSSLAATFFFFFSLLLQQTTAQVNEEIVRKVDLSMAVVRSQMRVRATGLKGNYVISMRMDLAEKLSFMQVVADNDQRVLPHKRIKNSDDLAHFEATLPQGTQEAILHIYVTYADVLVPMPAEIRQEDNQLVKYFDTHTVTSIYPTNSQTSTFSLGVTQVESFSKKSPYAFSGTDLVFGPYTDVGAGAGASFSNLDIHYENNAPFAKAIEAIREIEVSHWGNVAFEEYLEVFHAGAKLTGGFSRIDFQMRRAPASFQGLVAMLPPGAKNIYYRDQIGNISTSSVRQRPQGVELGIESRFPLFGGWKTQFYQGYSVPVQELLTVTNGNRYSLTVPFSVPYSEVWVEELTVKVVLPEWATDLKVELPFEVDEEEQTRRLTYLDTSLSGGRPVVVLKKRNVVAEHIQPMVVSYTFPKRAMLLEPLYLVLAFFIFFVVCMVFVRVDLRILANGGSSQASSSASLNKKKQ